MITTPEILQASKATDWRCIHNRQRKKPTDHCLHYRSWMREVSRSIQVLSSKFKMLFFKWNPLKVQKLPFLYWPLETTDPVHTIKSEQCWNLLLLLANVSWRKQKIILKENLYSLNSKYWKYKIFVTRSRSGSGS